MGLSCEKNQEPARICIKGKLMLKGICKNYVIGLVDGEIDANLIEKKWINPMTKEEYTNVFGLASICTFPENIVEGQEFYFTVLNLVEPAICEQCKAYAPAPYKKLHISVCSVN
jgi:hypothetical protein